VPTSPRPFSHIRFDGSPFNPEQIVGHGVQATTTGFGLASVLAACLAAK
jgi:hypothetical protein